MKPSIAAAFICAAATVALGQQRSVVIATSLALDGKGAVLRDTRIVVEAGKIVRLEPGTAPADYDLRGLTVLPGWIDTHVHITYHFGPNGKFQDPNETPQQAELAIAGNAWVTLMAGFTTVQSVGSPADVPLRDAIANGLIPGPRILTAVRPLMGRGSQTGTPEEIRQYIEEVKAQGADLIKIFASGSIRVGGNPTLSQEQLNAACDEAKKLGLRTLVHAYRDSVRMATLAGCTQVEHGTYATPDDLKLMAAHATYFDPQAGLVDENYVLFKNRYLGVGNYTEEGFKLEQESIPLDHDLFRQAIAIKGLKIVFGTDAVAGAHGRNAEELIDRVRDCGQAPMAAMVSANWLAAQSLNLENEIGSIAAGRAADLIALDGNPLQDITAVRRVVFVMKSGIVYKNVARSAIPQYTPTPP
ncbi:MAG: amidohydrolase family protein [Acidobacteriaceae bacterium]|nr:amidohydrolase family protein [Acidobacteriaceae bacterium]